ncbi:MAG: hypothetical protein [Siphoviridae sp. ctvD11]|nr:MAG: hypothetical protein [Siphoviridae sp. ctvD11]
MMEHDNTMARRRTVKLKVPERFSPQVNVICVLRNAKTNKIEGIYKSHNVVCNLGKNAVAARLNNETTYTTIINEGAVGTGTATPLATDTQLGTENTRFTLTSNYRSRTNNVTTLEFYFSPSQANTHLTEFGAFIDGTGAANSGQMFNHATIDVTKVSTQSLSVFLEITVS